MRTLLTFLFSFSLVQAATPPVGSFGLLQISGPFDKALDVFSISTSEFTIPLDGAPGKLVTLSADSTATLVTIGTVPSNQWARTITVVVENPDSHTLDWSVDSGSIVWQTSHSTSVGTKAAFVFTYVNGSVYGELVGGGGGGGGGGSDLWTNNATVLQPTYGNQGNFPGPFMLIWQTNLIDASDGEIFLDGGCEVIRGNAVANTTTTAPIAGEMAGLIGAGQSGVNVQYGVIGYASPVYVDGRTNIGVGGMSAKFGSTGVYVGGYFGIADDDSTKPTFVESALLLDTFLTGSPLLTARSNLVTVASINPDGSISTQTTNQWAFKTATTSGTNNLVINVNGHDYTLTTH